MKNKTIKVLEAFEDLYKHRQEKLRKGLINMINSYKQKMPFKLYGWLRGQYRQMSDLIDVLGLKTKVCVDENVFMVVYWLHSSVFEEKDFNDARIVRLQDKMDFLVNQLIHIKKGEYPKYLVCDNCKNVLINTGSFYGRGYVKNYALCFKCGKAYCFGRNGAAKEEVAQAEMAF